MFSITGDIPDKIDNKAIGETNKNYMDKSIEINNKRILESIK